MARVGEANIPEKLTVLLIEQVTAPSRKNPSWMNLASEAIARIGVSAVSTGTTLRLLHLLKGETTVTEARDLPELADQVMSLWHDITLGVAPVDAETQADIIIAGEDEMSAPETRRLVAFKPTVVLSYGHGKPVSGPSVLNFTGNEDISRMVVGVLSR